MIRVNLLTSERKVAKKRIAPFQGQHVAMICGALVLVTAAGVGWRYWALGQESARLDENITASQNQAVQLRAVITQVQQFEQRKKQLQDRVGLIETLRSAQTGPVHLLDEVSRSMPPLLWLTELKQTPNNDDVLIEGRCTTLTSLSDFVGSLEQSGYFKRSIEIVSTVADTSRPELEMIRFQIKAVFQRPGDNPALQTVAHTTEGKP